MALKAGVRSNVLAGRSAPRQAVVAVKCNLSQGPRPTLRQLFNRSTSNSSASTSGAEQEQQGPLSTNRRWMMIGGASAALAACPCCTAGPANAAEWGYGFQNGPPGLAYPGPKTWAGTCVAGQAQTPINIPLATQPHSNLSPFGDLVFDMKTPATSVLNTGHGTMQVNFSSGNYTTIGDGRIELELMQFHFHTPSEHAIDGMRYGMEAHLVHKIKATDGLAVVGVMLHPDPSAAYNETLQAALEGAPRSHGAKVKAERPFDPMKLLPPADGTGRRPYVHYEGSLTTPPCTEGVEWFVLTKPVPVHPEQIIEFMRFVGDGTTFGFNSRPLVPLNGRPLEYFD